MNSESGMTLVEVAIAAGISVILVAGASVFLSSSMKALSSASAKENGMQQARVISKIVSNAFMTRDIAGGGGFDLQDSAGGNKYSKFVITRKLATGNETVTVETSCKVSSNSQTKSIKVPSFCGHSCGTGESPVTTITKTKNGTSATQTFPKIGTKVFFKPEPVGVTTCVADPGGDGLSLLVQVAYLNPQKTVVTSTIDEHLMLKYFQNPGAYLVPTE